MTILMVFLITCVVSTYKHIFFILVLITVCEHADVSRDSISLIFMYYNYYGYCKNHVSTMSEDSNGCDNSK